ELLFACSHPAIELSIRAPLMMQTVLGFPVRPIAGALNLPPETLNKRLTRAKRRIRDARIAFAVPDRSVLSDRLPPVLEAIYGCYSLAWSDPTAPEADSMANEARHLAITLATLLEDEPEAWGLASLISFSLSRSEGRLHAYVPLEDQDPTGWDSGLIAEAES